MQQFKDKVAVVTGAAGGIGEAIVRQFLAQGASVVFCDRDIERGEALEKTLGAQGLPVRFVACDVSKVEQADALIAQTLAWYGQLDVLVNNAAIRRFQNILDADPQSWDDVLGVNLMGAINCARPAVAAMVIRKTGVVVNIASVRSLVAGANNLQYDTSKAALLGLTRGLARDHAADGVRAVAIGPGPIYTHFHEQRAIEMGQSDQEYKDWFGLDTMLKHPGVADDIANAVLFVASDKASFITGTCLYVDGGQTGL